MKKGDRVKFSKAGIKAGDTRRDNGRVGTVIGFSRDKAGVYVRWDGGHKQGESYPKHFLELCPAPHRLVGRKGVAKWNDGEHAVTITSVVGKFAFVKYVGADGKVIYNVACPLADITPD